MAAIVASQVAYDMIKKFESCRLSCYLDATGNVTIGWGHKCTDAAPYRNLTISQGTADEILKIDVGIAIEGIKKFTLVNLSQEQIDALTSFVYNVGIGNYYKSSLRKHINMSDYHGAADQFLVWDSINGHHNHWQGQRRLAEHDLFLKGTK